MIHWFEALRSDRESFDSEPDFENDSVAQTRGSNPARGGWLVTNVTKTPPYRSEHRPDTVAGDICRVLPCSASFSPASGSSKIGPLPLRSERSTIWANSPSCVLKLVCKYWKQVRNSTSLSVKASTVRLLTEHKIRGHIIIVSRYNTLYLSDIQSQNLFASSHNE